MFYFVLHIHNDHVAYAGIREGLAAAALGPGTTFGCGATEALALRVAMARARRARWAYGELGLGPRNSFDTLSSMRSDDVVHDIRGRNGRQVLPNPIKPPHRKQG